MHFSLPRAACVKLGATVAFYAAVLANLQAYGNVTLSAPWSDGVILQRDKPIHIWGNAHPGESISIKFKSQARHVCADAQGRWRAELAPEPASTDPATIQLKGENAVTIHDVLVGDVWICSGQSNMNHPLSAARDAEQEIAAANYPLIRHLAVRSTISPKPLEAATGEWRACAPANASSFTAVGYFFAREVHRDLGVPVGVIKSTLGGSPIEAWISPDALSSTPASRLAIDSWDRSSLPWRQRAAEHAAILAAWQSRADQASAEGRQFSEEKPEMTYDESDRNMPGGLYNGFIHPLRRFSVAGFLWYQGESNADRADDYRALFPLMIRQWRQSFKDPDLPFLFVQLPNFIRKDDGSGVTWAALREAQAAALHEPHTGMAVTIDVGDPHNLHPSNKQEVGRRLALIALRKIYGRQVVDSGPALRSVERRGTTVVVHFDHAEGLRFERESDAGFLLAEDDDQFIPAGARIDGRSVLLAAPGVHEPSVVRFVWENNPALILRNSAGLPAAPFQANIR